MSTSPVKFRITLDTRGFVRGVKKAKRHIRLLRFRLRLRDWLRKWFS